MLPLKHVIKRIQRTIKIYIVAPLAALLIYCIYKTIRWERNDSLSIDASQPFIAAFWHGRQLMLAPLFQTASLLRPLTVLISAHTDGRMIAAAIRFFGLDSVAGSSSKGGVKAMMQLLELLQSGMCIGITPDGPRGPAFKAKEGVVKLAQLSGAPIYPISYSSSSVWCFKSWDRMILPKPFTKGVCLVGKPLLVPKNSEPEDLIKYLTELEQRLIEVTNSADEFSYA